MNFQCPSVFSSDAGDHEKSSAINTGISLKCTLDLLHEYDPLPQPLSQNGRGEPALALLPWWEKGKAFGLQERDEGARIDARGLLTQRITRWLQIGLLSVLICAMWTMPPCLADSEETTLELIKPMSFSNGDLRGKDFSLQDLRAADFANANMERANFSNADLRGAIFSASVMQNANLQGANFQFAMIDQVNFTDANLEDAILSEALLFRSTFKAAHITGADFSDALLDGEQRNILCQTATGINSKTGMSTRESLNCKS